MTAWTRSRTLEDLGEYNAQWLEGRISWNPTLPGNRDQGVHPETRPYVPLLAALNRASFVTFQSQPGEVCHQIPGCGPPDAVSHHQRRGWHEEHEGYSRWQHAHVDGFVAEQGVLDGLRKCCEAAGLTVMSWSPSDCHEAGITFVTDGHRRQWVAYTARPELAVRCPSLHPSSATAWFVAVVDPKAGCNDRLWSTLGRWVEQAAQVQS